MICIYGIEYHKCPSVERILLKQNQRQKFREWFYGRAGIRIWFRVFSEPKQSYTSLEVRPYTGIQGFCLFPGTVRIYQLIEYCRC